MNPVRLAFRARFGRRIERSGVVYVGRFYRVAPMNKLKQKDRDRVCVIEEISPYPHTEGVRIRFLDNGRRSWMCPGELLPAPEQATSDINSHPRVKEPAMDALLDEYNRYFEETEDATAAALLCVAKALNAVSQSAAGLGEHSLGHEICMGIRHGLYGARAEDEADIRSEIGDLATAVKEANE